MLTTEQLATLKAYIIADPVAGPIRAAGDTYSLLAWCNGPSATQAWAANVSPQVADEAANYTTFDSLTAGKRDSWKLFLAYPRSYGRNKVRNWVTDVWGAATAASVAEAVLTAGTEKARNAELAFGGSNKTTGTVTALDRTFVGLVDQQDANVLVN